MHVIVGTTRHENLDLEEPQFVALKTRMELFLTWQTIYYAWSLSTVRKVGMKHEAI